MVAIALGLAASLSWGIADFIGGIQSRRMPVVAVVLGSQLAGLALVVVIVAVRGEAPPDGDFALYAALSSVGGIVGLVAGYSLRAWLIRHLHWGTATPSATLSHESGTPVGRSNRLVGPGTAR